MVSGTGANNLRDVTLIKRFLSGPVLKLAVFTGISSLLVTFAVGYFVQNAIYSKNEDVTAAHLFWFEYVASPLAVSTLLGVLSSRARHGRQISPLQTFITLAVVPLIALWTFLVAYFIISVFYNGHYTPAVALSTLALAFVPVAIVVRWSVHLFCGLKKHS
jgi:hypothetical protein